MATRSTSEGMTPGAFMAELRKYPVVRSRDYIGPMVTAGTPTSCAGFATQLTDRPMVAYSRLQNLAGSADKARKQSATAAPTTTTHTVSAAAQTSTSGEYAELPCALHVHHPHFCHFAPPLCRTGGSTPSQPPQVSFMAQLRGLLGEHYSAEDVSTIMREFETVSGSGQLLCAPLYIALCSSTVLSTEVYVCVCI